MLPFRENVGEDPEKPGFGMPSPSFGFGFLRLDLNGDFVTEESTVEPLDPKIVDVVCMEAVLPFVAAK